MYTALLAGVLPRRVDLLKVNSARSDLSASSMSPSLADSAMNPPRGSSADSQSPDGSRRNSNALAASPLGQTSRFVFLMQDLCHASWHLTLSHLYLLSKAMLQRVCEGYTNMNSNTNSHLHTNLNIQTFKCDFICQRRCALVCAEFSCAVKTTWSRISVSGASLYSPKPKPLVWVLTLYRTSMQGNPLRHCPKGKDISTQRLHVTQASTLPLCFCLCNSQSDR